ncbi:MULTISPECIES: hypothetical protein [Bacteria]
MSKATTSIDSAQNPSVRMAVDPLAADGDAEFRTARQLRLGPGVEGHRCSLGDAAPSSGIR